MLIPSRTLFAVIALAASAPCMAEDAEPAGVSLKFDYGFAGRPGAGSPPPETRNPPALRLPSLPPDETAYRRRNNLSSAWDGSSDWDIGLNFNFNRPPIIELAPPNLSEPRKTAPGVIMNKKF